MGMKFLAPIGLAALLVAAACGQASSRSDEETVHVATAEDSMLNEIEFETITRQPMPLSQFAGQTLLVVNTASQCGYTPQYQGLQALWDTYGERGLVVIGVPSNDFGGQEPGSEEEVARFCEINYGVDFPLTAKTTVVGPGRHEFYAWAEQELGASARPRWNFHKILIGPEGQPLAAFPSSVTPQSRELIDAIEAEIGP